MLFIRAYINENTVRVIPQKAMNVQWFCTNHKFSSRAPSYHKAKENLACTCISFFI